MTIFLFQAKERSGLQFLEKCVFPAFHVEAGPPRKPGPRLSGHAAKAGPKTLRPRRESRAKNFSGHAAKAVSRDCSECYWYYGYNG